MRRDAKKWYEEWKKKQGETENGDPASARSAPANADAEPAAKTDPPKRNISEAKRRELIREVEEQIIRHPAYQAELQKIQEAKRAKLERIKAAQAAGEITPEIWDRARLYAVIKYTEAQLAGKTEGLSHEEVKMQAADNVIARLLQLLNPEEGNTPENGLSPKDVNNVLEH